MPTYRLHGCTRSLPLPYAVVKAKGSGYAEPSESPSDSAKMTFRMENITSEVNKMVACFSGRERQLRCRRCRAPMSGGQEEVGSGCGAGNNGGGREGSRRQMEDCFIFRPRGNPNWQGPPLSKCNSPSGSRRQRARLKLLALLLLLLNPDRGRLSGMVLSCPAEWLLSRTGVVLQHVFSSRVTRAAALDKWYESRRPVGMHPFRAVRIGLDRSIPTSIPEGFGPHNRADAWEFPFSANLEVSTQNSCGISYNHPINLNFGYVTLGCMYEGSMSSDQLPRTQSTFSVEQEINRNWSLHQILIRRYIRHPRVWGSRGHMSIG
ncbi:hypothetical protein FB451DRAFT_1177157 [Mycena latifolia]|nr:hypothetical protein FB451DRAFT_1177157 [Mycena latifolia]